MRSLFTVLGLIVGIVLFGQEKNGLQPDFVVAQYAGSIGYFSFGTGYDIFKNRGRISVHFGNVPREYGGVLNIASGKFLYSFSSIPLSNRLTFKPIDAGIILSYHFGDNFKLNVPNYFKTDNYYWWHTAMRLHLATESSVSLHFSRESIFRSLTGYLEMNSNDLYIVSFINNTSSLKPHQLIKVGVGLRLHF